MTGWLLLGLFQGAYAQTEKTIWLDEMDLSTMTCGWDEPKKNKSVEGWQALKLNGKTYERGVGTHASSEFVINLQESANRFSALVGLDDKAGQISGGGTAIFKVFVDGKLVFESGLMNASMEPKKISIDLKKAKQMKLVVEHGGDGTHGDHADWAMANITYRASGQAPKALYEVTKVAPYILTPAEDKKPSINGPGIYGARPESPFFYRIPVSGAKPVEVTVKGLPEGLHFDPEKRIISGTTSTRGKFVSTITAKNSFGQHERELEIVIGDTLLLTPPMGWNSWNAYGLTIDAETVKKVVDVFEKTGLVEYGFSYINIDDGWEAPARDAQGNILANEKFPDMKGLANYIHDRGFKFGIYSSPGPFTCGNFLGSYQHEAQDAATYADWGVDYLKYDWCSYDNISKGRNDITELKKPYLVMNEALKAQKRDIVYSLCQYGMGNVSEWGASVGGQLWRTTGDIVDTWGSLNSIALAQIGLEKNAGPGRWNDPDMLILGKVGWGKGLRETRLNAYEQYTHITLWCMLSAPLLLGCDIESMDEYTLSLLKNSEVLAVNQDRFGKQASVVQQQGEVRIWKKLLSGNRVAVALVNHGYEPKEVTLKLSEIGINNPLSIRDVWRKKNLENVEVVTIQLPAHASELYVIQL